MAAKNDFDVDVVIGTAVGGGVFLTRVAWSVVGGV